MLSFKWCTLSLYILFYLQGTNKHGKPFTLPLLLLQCDLCTTRSNEKALNRNPQPPLFILWYICTTFPQFDDLIKHSRENHPYHCYYCKTTFVLFEEVIKHSTENHGSLMFKVKYLELNPSSGHYGYRSHNFNVIPEKIKALGQKIQTDCTSNALTIHNFF